jgi:hypothetical protein
LSASIVSVQVLAVPEQSPLQLWNDHPLGVEAFRAYPKTPITLH